jgi:hypothetical protein
VRFADVLGTRTDENNWLRSWTNQLYLWYREVPDQDPANFTTAAYFDLLKTTATTPSGADKDKFHFTVSTADWFALSQSGQQVGYGAQVLFIDNVDLVNDNTQAGINTLNAGLSPTTVGETHTFVVQDLGAAGTRTVTLRADTVTSAPVQNVRTISTTTGTVGYMQFNDHLATAEAALAAAVNTLRTTGITDLMLDIRYNGGGYLDIASELAFMIAGAGPTAGRPFETLQFNDKYPSTDPVTGLPLTPTPFHSTSRGFSVAAGQQLPPLNLSRVFVLTGPGTCSASESIINSLRGVGVDVIQVGSTTCGKPYGFYPQDNCGTTYFSIEFRGVNALGFGDYTDGFSPANSTVVTTPVPGCSVADDFTHALGDAAEGRLSVALSYRQNPACPAPTGIGGAKISDALGSSDGVMIKSPLLENRIISR